MTEPTDADRAKAAEITGCKPYVARVETEWDWSYCTTHDVDGNPRWEQCRWAPVAAALAAERAAAVADLRARVLALAGQWDLVAHDEEATRAVAIWECAAALRAAFTEETR